MTIFRTNIFYKIFVAFLVMFLGACQDFKVSSSPNVSQVKLEKLKADWNLCLPSADLSYDLGTDIMTMDNSSIVVSGRYYRREAENLELPTTSIVSNISITGRINWTIQLEGSAYIHKVITTDNQNIMGFGYTQNVKNNPTQAAVFKLSKSGEVIFQKALRGSKDFIEISDAILLDNDHFILAGKYSDSKSNDTKSVFMARIDQNGTIGWTKFFKDTNPKGVIKIFQGKHGGYALVFNDYRRATRTPNQAEKFRQGKKYHHSYGVNVVKIDGVGNIQNKIRLKTGNRMENLRALNLQSGDIVLTMSTRNKAKKHDELIFLVLSDDLNIKKQVTITDEPVQINDIQQSQDGTIYASGQTMVKDFGRANLWLSSFSSEVELQSEGYLNSRGHKDWANAFHLDELNNKIHFTGQRSKKNSSSHYWKKKRGNCLWVVQTGLHP